MIVDSDDRVFCRYSNREFDINVLNSSYEFLKHSDVNQEVINKPKGCLWGSPVDAVVGWKEFYSGIATPDQNAFKYKTLFKLKPGSKVLKVDFNEVTNDRSDIYKYVRESSKGLSSVLIDFKQMIEDGIDAVELLDAYVGHAFINKVEAAFNSWDCESIVILNKDCLDILEIDLSEE